MKTFTPSKENFIQFNRFFSRQTRLRWMEIDQVCQMSMDECSQKLYTTRYKKLRTIQVSLVPDLLRSLSLCSCQLEFLRAQLRKNPTTSPPLEPSLPCKKKFAECNALFSDGGEWRGGPLLKYKTSYYIVPALPCPPLHLPPPILMCK